MNFNNFKSLDNYLDLYNDSINNNELFWDQVADRINWFSRYSKVKECNYENAEIKWYLDGKLNVSFNCIDRNIQNGLGDKTAIIWQGNEFNDSKNISYNQLLKDVSKFANGLKSLGVEKGDRVCIYMQMIPELTIAMLACARIGAIHSIVFGAFSSNSLRDRINDSSCKVLISQDTGIRGSKKNIPMKENGDKAISECPSIEHQIIVKRTGKKIDFNEDCDIWWHELVSTQSENCPAVIMDSEDPLFILYTSGSTGKPKGVLHTTGGYIVYASYTHELVFNYNKNDIYWCTADIGWITGHSYIVYGPLSNGATSLMFEGVPTYPDFGRFWEIVDKYKVNTFYTAPTALRALMKEGNSYVEKYDLSSLKILGTVGETIKEPEWNWYYNIIGKKSCPIIDTWWQTETGGVLISPIPHITKLKPGSATFPLFGIQPVLLDEGGNEIISSPAEGYLAIKDSWPGQMRTLYGNHKRFFDTYFSQFKGYYFTGDGAKRDADGAYWITGRVDDVLNVSGHRLGTAEIEGAIGSSDSVAEAAVVGFPHDIKGQAVFAFVTLMTGVEPSKEICSDIKSKVRQIIGPHATPEKIKFSIGLPKTRSGKIMRRILRKIAEGNTDDLGDISTLADPTVINELIKD